MKVIIESCLNIGSGSLQLISGYIFGLYWGKDFIYLFDSHSKYYEGNISKNGSAILMKFEALDDFQDYIKLIYYSSQHHKTVYFQIQFISIRCSSNLRESLRSELILNGPKVCTRTRKHSDTRNTISKKPENSNIEKVYFRNRSFC